MLRLVGDSTFSRGRAYADDGAVRRFQWLANDRQLFGDVVGSNPAPYTAWVRLGRADNGRLTSFQGTCTCPVHVDCKHAVAVFLAALADAEKPAAPVAVAQPWERSLRGLLSDDAADGGSDPNVGLQFEIVEPSRSYRTGLAAPLRLGMRPVTRGQRGGWIRSGISWQYLATAWGPGRGVPEHIRLLREIATMDTAARPSYYGTPSQLIFLEALPNKRIWDVLAEAKASGMPLVQPNRSAPVGLLDEPAQLSVEVARDAGDLTLQPRLTAAGERLALDAMMLLGEPTHGVAWWQTEGVDPMTDGDLRLAAFAEPVDPVLADLVATRGVRVPANGESRFFAQYYPSLMQRVRLVADESVELPQQEPPVLVLDLEYAADERLRLTWRWSYAIGEAARREPLWSTATPSRGRDSEQEAVIVKAVEAAAGQLTALFGGSLLGERLAATVMLDGFDAVRFISDVLPVIRELPGVVVESTGTPRDYREAQSGPVVAIDATGVPGDRDWLDLAVTVTVDGEEVPFDRLFVALASGQQHLVLPTGTWFALDRPELAALADLIAEARAINDTSPQTARVGRFQSDLWEELERLGVISGQAAEWRASMQALRQVTQVEVPPLPPGLTAVLRPYQADGFGWLAFLHSFGLGGVLADEMGLGKTVQAIALMCHAKSGGERAPFLVVAPTSVVYNWSAECERFAPGLDVRIVTETEKRRATTIAELAEGADVVVTSYALFRLEYDEYAATQWAGLVLDEAQFVKNSKSRAYRCAKLLPAPFKLAITGTPMENNLLELWSLLSITAPGLFPHPAGFEKHYRTPIEKNDDRERLEQLRRRVRPLMLRRTKEQVVSDLPDKQEQVVELPLNAKHRRVYQLHLQRERQKVLGLLGNLERNRFEIFRSLTLLRQASLDPVLIDPRYYGVPSTKLDALMELLTEISSEGHRTLVFSQFTRFLGNAKARLDQAGIDYCYLDGKTRRRPEVLERFRTGNAPVFLISLKAGGFGLNLTEADYCVLLDPWWNPATEAQAVDRLHRIGQTRNVMVYRLVAKDTIEEKVMALKARKAALFDSVMADGEVAPGALTAADIRGILD
ncbi:MAG TPA: DEAD/DEAH box helicase [Mycobacteriales bacterium]|nr:DEAD/DEAH box helicase [Mycobacteriales bacterium]